MNIEIRCVRVCVRKREREREKGTETSIQKIKDILTFDQSFNTKHNIRFFFLLKKVEIETETK